MIPVTYSKHHKKHQPEVEFVGNEFYPHSDSPLRIEETKKALESIHDIQFFSPKQYSMNHLQTVHTSRYIDFIQTYYSNELASVFPSMFPLGKFKRFPDHSEGQHGYFFSDLSTPIYPDTFEVAWNSTQVALTAFDILHENITKLDVTYALCRPPGHHAEQEIASGFCYFNNAALVATRALSRGFKPIILDLDFHHGNGTQAIFYDNPNVAFLSIHGHPRSNFPYYSGYEDERGINEGEGYNFNFPLKLHTAADLYFSTLQEAVKRINTLVSHDHFDLLILSVGYDTFKEDELGYFNLRVSDYKTIGEILHNSISLPKIIIQEGGYNLKKVGNIATQFLKGLIDI